MLDILREILQERPPWYELAACKGQDTKIFFPEPEEDRKRVDNEDVRLAYSFCEKCPVQKQCLRYATENFEVGIWGKSRERIRRRHRSNIKNGNIL